MSEILKRSDVDIANTWALEDIYASDDLWEAEVKTFLELCDKLSHTHICVHSLKMSVYKCCLYMHINMHILTQSVRLQRAGHN